MKKTLLYLVLVGFAVGITASWWHGSKDLFASGTLEGSLIGIGRLVGLAAAFLLPMQLILIGRVKWVETVFGLDKLSRLHRTMGLIIFGLIIAHPFIIIFAYSRLNETGVIAQFLTFISTRVGETLEASLGVGILLITIFWSLTIVRRRLKYEWWYWVHVFNYLAISLIFLHVKQQTATSQYWEWPALWIAIYVFTALNVIWFRFTRPTLKFWKHQFRIEQVNDLGLATSVYITGQHMDEFQIKAGQFMIFRFLQKGFFTQAHPFSLSQAPNGKNLRLTAKKLGDFTNELPKLQVGTQVVIDGPHGVFTEQQINHGKLLFIAGGIGITPIRSMLEDLGTRFPDKILLYSNKTPSERILGDEIDDLSEQNHFKVVNIYAAEAPTSAEQGQLDQNMLGRLVPDIAERDIFLCGPPAMMISLRKAMINLGVSKANIHFERFAL